MTLYVSTLAHNGLPEGSASGLGTRAMPFDTLSAAIAVAADNETIVLNGPILEAATVAIGIPVRLEAHKDHAASLGLSTAQGYVLNLAGDTAEEFRIGAIELRGANCTTGHMVAQGNNQWRLAMTGTTYTGNGRFGLFVSAQNLTLDWTDIHGDRRGVEQTLRELLYTTAAAAGTNWTLRNIRNDIRADILSASGGMLVRATAAGARFDLRGLSGQQQQLGTASWAGGCLVENVADAVIDMDGGELYFEEPANTTVSCNGLQIAAATATAIQCDRGVIKNGTIRYGVGVDAGIGAIVGRDGANANADDKCNNGRIQNLKVYGAPQLNFIHGIMFGNNTGCCGEQLYVEDCGLSLQFKQNDGGLFRGCVVVNPALGVSTAGTALRFKGSSNSVYANCQVVANGVETYHADADLVLATAGDDASNTAGCAVVNTDFLVAHGANIDTIASIGNSQAVRFAKNNYQLSGGATTESNVFSYQGTGYTSVGAWAAARDPWSTTEAYPARTAADMGVAKQDQPVALRERGEALPLMATGPGVDFAGDPFRTIPTVGPHEYASGARVYGRE